MLYSSKMVGSQNILKGKNFLYFSTVADLESQCLPLISKQATHLLQRGWGAR